MGTHQQAPPDDPSAVRPLFRLFAPWTLAAVVLAVLLALQLGSYVARPPEGGMAIQAAEVRRLTAYLGERVVWLVPQRDTRGDRLGGLRAELPPRWREGEAQAVDARRMLLFVDGQLVPIGFGPPDQAAPLPQAFVRSPRAGGLILRCPPAPACSEVIAVRPDLWLDLVLQMSRLVASPGRTAGVLLLAGLWAVAVWSASRSWAARRAGAAVLAGMALTAGWFAGTVFTKRWGASFLLAELALFAVPVVAARHDAGGTASRAWKRHVLNWGSRIGLLVALPFGLLAAGRAMQDGVCCADDALFAVAAKDLARGYGYPQGAGHGVEETYFGLSDGHITVGPALVVPVAAAIAMFGNRHWVPGLVSVALWVSLLAFVIAALRPFGDVWRRNLCVGLFLLSCYAFTVWHFEHWYAMLGEVPAALMVWLAVSIWARRPRSRSSLRIASLLMGLACLTKLVTALCIPPFLAGVALAGGIRDRSRIARAGREVMASLLWLLLPAALFQLYRLAAAGPGGYLGENGRWLAYVLSQAASEPRGATLLTDLATIHRQAGEHFGIGPAGLLLISGFALFVVVRHRRPHLRLQAAVLFGCVLTNVTWWLFISKGWPRYLLIGLILAIALWVLPLLALRATPRILAYSVFLMACTVPNWAFLGLPVRSATDGWFSPTVSARNAMAVAARLDAVPGEVPLYGQWWGTIADLEYLSADVGRLRRLPRSSLGQPEAYGIVFNSNFLWRPDPELDRRLSECRRDPEDRRPYVIYWCGSAALPWSP